MGIQDYIYLRRGKMFLLFPWSMTRNAGIDVAALKIPSNAPFIHSFGGKSITLSRAFSHFSKALETRAFLNIVAVKSKRI